MTCIAHVHRLAVPRRAADRARPASPRFDLVVRDRFLRGVRRRSGAAGQGHGRVRARSRRQPEPRRSAGVARVGPGVQRRQGIPEGRHENRRRVVAARHRGDGQGRGARAGQRRRAHPARRAPAAGDAEHAARDGTAAAGEGASATTSTSSRCSRRTSTRSAIIRRANCSSAWPKATAGWASAEKARLYFDRLIKDAPTSGQVPKAQAWLATGAIPKSAGLGCVGCHK